MFGHQHWHGPRPAFASGWESGPFEAGWQPWAREPWGPPLGRMLWRMARRFPFGPGMGPGHPRMFGHGQLKYVLLELLLERPKHGYEMIKELEERTSGFYSPSAGAVYPTLQLLEDRGWVTSQSVEGKKVYSITDAGREALKANQQRERPTPEPDAFGTGPGFGGPFHHGFHPGPFGRGPFGRHARPELHALRHEAMEVARLMRAAVLASGGDPQRLERLRGIVERTRHDLNVFLGQEEPGPKTGGPTPTGEGPIEHV